MPNGNITKVTSPTGRFIELTYDGLNRITQAKDNIGRTVGYEYDGAGRLWKVTDARGGVTEYTSLDDSGAPPPRSGARRHRASRQPQAPDIAHRMLTISASGRGERAKRVEPQRAGVGPRER